MAERNRRKMDFNQLSYFIAIARYGNFTAAAKAFFVSQPCISHQIQSLEKELGVRLFIRNTRSVELTAAGEIFLEDAKKMVDLMERAEKTDFYRMTEILCGCRWPIWLRRPICFYLRLSGAFGSSILMFKCG